MEYYRRGVDVMESLQSTLEGRISEASGRLPREKLDPETIVKHSPKYTAPRRGTMQQKQLVYIHSIFNLMYDFMYIQPYILVPVLTVMKRMIIHRQHTLKNPPLLQGNLHHNHVQKPCMTLSRRMKES